MFDFGAQSLLLFKGNWVILILFILILFNSIFRNMFSLRVCFSHFFLGLIFFFILTRPEHWLQNNRNTPATRSRMQVYHATTVCVYVCARLSNFGSR